MSNAQDGDQALKKTLLQKLLAWTESDLSLWQRDAVRRLFQTPGGELTAMDYDELFRLMKSANKVGGTIDVKPDPLSSKHLPASATIATHAVLVGLRELKHVNRIPDTATLPFAANGLTVIYGANGSGKSGYSRVMKRACRARDQSEPIHPDASDPSATGKLPTAIFDLEVNGKAEAINWKLGDPGPDLLATVAVFDAHCARIYLSAENDVAYLPYGLDVLETLAQKTVPTIAALLEEEISGIDVDVTPHAHLIGATVVGKRICSLSAQTDEQDLQKLGTVTDAERDRLGQLQKMLSEPDPASKAKALRLTAQRFKGASDRVTGISARVNDAEIARHRSLDEEALTAKKAAQLAAESFRAGETLLPGTGDAVWKQLFDAARKFSTEAAYCGKPFPHVEEGALCPLCQQELSDGADRLNRFEAFVRQDTAKALQVADSAVTQAVSRLTASTDLKPDDATTAELAESDATLPPLITALVAECDARKKWMVASFSSHDWSAPPSLTGDPRTAIGNIIVDITTAADAMDAVADGAGRQAIQTEHDELAARVALSSSLKPISELVRRMKLKSSLEACRKALKTNAISSKAKALASEEITTGLKSSLDSQFDLLGVGHISTKLIEKVEKGKMKHRLVLNLPATYKIDEILSEGEQRAIALGAFLAELELAGHSGAVVFDDPVSSLDHQRKRNIARCLAEVSGKRQVIVFTHDLVFLSQLIEGVEDNGTAHLAHWLERDATGRPGQVRVDDCPAMSKAYRTTKRAKASLARASALGGEERVTAIRQGMGELRRTLEEIVQEYLFKNVIARWRENLMLTKVKSIQWDNAVADEVDALMAELSRHIEGHSHSEEHAGGMPVLDDLEKCIRRVDAVIESAKKARK